MRIGVLGAGGWGTALARLLALRGHDVSLWARRRGLAEELERTRENPAYLGGARLPEAVVVTAELARALCAAELIVVAVPVQHLRVSLQGASSRVPPAAVRLSAVKGIERPTLFRVSQILSEIWSPGPVACLSGPSFAAEVARGEPTQVTVASADAEIAGRIRRAMTSETFGIHASDDLIGVELAGSLKNVIAIAAGMVRGLGFGHNAVAALLTRGLDEMSRLGVALGGRRETFLGLPGVGDLFLTATGSLSRNGRVGEALARGAAPGAVLGDSTMVAEGIETAPSAVALGERAGVDMPITSAVAAVLHGGRDPRRAVAELMLGEIGAE